MRVLPLAQLLRHHIDGPLDLVLLLLHPLKRPQHVLRLVTDMRLKSCKVFGDLLVLFTLGEVTESAVTKLLQVFVGCDERSSAIGYEFSHGLV